MHAGGSTVTTAVIPAAGFGTRFLPATKAVPKEMLPVIDRPMIEYAVVEAVAAGIEHVVIVVSEGKESIEAHFETQPDLEAHLEAKGKVELLEMVRERSSMATIEYVIQEEQLGLGHAVGVGREAVGDRPFAVLLPDEVVTSGLLRRLVEVHRERGVSTIGLMEVPLEQISAYGCPQAKPVDDADDLVEVVHIVEKPPVDEAPSNLATIGRYVFSPEVWDEIAALRPGAGGELQLTDAIDALAGRGGVYGAVLREGRHDVGKVLDFLRATVELALDRDDLADEFGEFLADVVRRRGLV